MKVSRERRTVRTILSFAVVMLTVAYAQAQSATLTTLGVSPSNASPGAVVTLTASVAAGSTAATAGQILFCNANATYCEDAAILGSAWVTKAGTATLRRTFGIGSYNIKAVFKGTNTYATSTSSPQTVTVAGATPLATTTAISATGSSGSYILSGTVTTTNLVAPTGAVSFVDATTSQTLASASLGTSSVTSSFSTASGPTLTTKDQAIAVGDFNNDGYLDYVVANSDGTAAATIMLGNGDGTFRQGATYSINPYPEAAVVADFNGDGNLDIAFANSSGNGITILLGNGDGTFAVAANPNVGYAAGLAVGDFNGDGIPDLAVSNNPSNYQVTILLGNGDGTFTTGSSITVPAWSLAPEGVVAADFNLDGKTDLAITSTDTYTPSYTVTILMGNGDGTFTLGQSYATGAADLSVASGDFNGDGIPDLATANRYDDTVTILIGNGDGTFTAGTTVPTGSGPFAIISGDFNGDGFVDLATANYSASTITILLGNGYGEFSGSPASLITGDGPIGIISGDFNGDGAPDFITANFRATQSSILLQSVVTTATASTGTLSPSSTDSVYAAYGGDGNYAASQSTPAVLSSVVQSSQTITFPNPGPLTYGVAPVTLAATASSGLAVTYALISGPGVVSGNTLTITDVGSIVVQASQAGSTSYTAAPSVQITIAVSGITIPVGDTSTTVTAGQTVSIPLTVASVNGYAGTVSFTCTVPSAMKGASCSANSVPVSGGATVSTNVTLTTTGSQSAANTPRLRPWEALLPGTAFGLVLLAGVNRKRFWRQLLVGSAFVVLALLLGALVSCGSSSGGSSRSSSATPAGKYDLTVVASSGKATYTAHVPVIVQ
jgi:hypothetical protein